MSAGDWKDFYKAACEGDLALVDYYADAGKVVEARLREMGTSLVALRAACSGMTR
jgi:hypothetical protein